MLLFYEVISRATESLNISYPAMDEKAQELPPSPYVVELQRMFRSSPKQIKTTKPQLSPVPSKELISSVRDWRIAALAEALQTDGDRKLFAGLIAEPKTAALAQAIDAGVRITHARAHGETFGPAEGVLISPAITNRLKDRFGADHSWSSSQFETYAACPYKFFLENVLGLTPLGDLTLETDFARRGSLLHHVLATFHRKYGDAATEWSALSRDGTRFDTEIKQALQAAIEAMPREGIEAALLELDRRQIDKWTDRYREQHEKYDIAWTKSANIDEPPRPTHFELRFGRKHPREKGYEDPYSLDKAFELPIGGETVNIVGRIDRIDVGRAGGQTIFNVIDYKSGRRPTLTTDKIESGERLQPALYVMAAQALVFGPNATPLWSGYWGMQGGVTTDKRWSLHCSVDGKASDDWQALQEKVKTRVVEIVRAARRGDFSIDSRDPNCTSFCDFKTICRIAQARTTNKIPPPVGS
jgi:ATP-dependent helicase/DNAse subunit B